MKHIPWFGLFLVAASCLTLSLVGCEFLQRMVDSAGGPDEVIKGAGKLAEMVVPFPFDLLIPGAVSLFTALVMPKEKPA